MSGSKDLTRWNRAGLSRFTYVDGNAVEYLELLRRELAGRFQNTEWLSPPEPIPANETTRPDETLLERQKRLHTRNQRLLRTYLGDRRDVTWEISRTFARACHILTGYVDAWANEGYLGTATQWESVRRIVGLLDYYPAPPSSATTPLVLLAKKGASGLVAKGFQVRNTPPVGAEKVTFETLDDLFIDEALNELRPNGWDKSPDPAGTQAPDEEEFSPIAQRPIDCIQNIGPKYSEALGNLDTIYKLHAARSEVLLSTGLNPTLLLEFQAKATVVAEFVPGNEWASIFDWALPAIVQEPTASLAERTHRPFDEARAFQFKVALLGACLDQRIYADTRLKDFRKTPRRDLPADSLKKKSRASSSSPWQTPWRATGKPRIAPGQVALVYHRADDKAEAVMIAKVDPPDNRIQVVPGHASPDWHRWHKGDAVLRVAPRWKRKCWLNGINVVRTKAPHGLAAGSYICWKDEAGKYRYANVLKTDRQNLWLDTADRKEQPPEAGAEIMVAIPVNTRIMATELEAINDEVINAAVANKEMDFPPQGTLPIQVYKLFQPKPESGGNGNGNGGGGGGLLPPASVKGLGSFLFPSPLLPIDLVMLAVEMLLSLGLMIIPSTGMPVFKGMPFGGSLDNKNSAKEAAGALVEMLDNLGLPAMWDEDGWLVDTQGTPVYIEATCDFKPLPGTKFINTQGMTIGDPATLVCDGNKLLDDKGKPVGIQPHYSALGLADQEGKLFTLKMVAWSKPGEDEPTFEQKVDRLAPTLENPIKNADASAAIFQSIQRNSTGTGAFPEPLLAVLKGAPVVRGVVAPQDAAYIFDGIPDRIESGDWVVGLFEKGAIRALHVTAIDDYDTSGDDKAFALSLKDIPPEVGSLELVYADFRGEITADGANLNTTPLVGAIELASVPPTLTLGRKVLLWAEGDGKKPLLSKVIGLEKNKVTFDPAPTDYTAGELIIYGNVVAAGHGVAKPTVILGSGNAAETHQEFTLEVKGVSFTPDPTMRSGFAAAVEVEVAGRVWQQVSSLKDSQPGDHHYVTRMTEQGHIRFLFGDGQNGRRLPTGRNNVRVRYRLGCGLAGNLPLHSLEELVNQHPLVKSVRQPAGAVGGGDMESTDSLRNTAPATLLALERAVSLSDFADLAKGRSDIWQAQARYEVTNMGRRDEVVVTIVPAGGNTSDTILDDVRLYLEAHALPELRVSVKRFTPSTDFSLDILVRVRSSAYLPEEVTKAVSGTIVSRFSLENRRLGAGLYLSEIYQVVEGVTGVENSVCLLTRAGEPLQVIHAGNDQTLVYLDAANLYVHHEEYTA